MKNKPMFLCLSIAAAIAGLPTLAAAQSPSSANLALADVHTAELPRVTRTVDSRAVSTLANSHLTLFAKAIKAVDVDDATPLNHLQLVLKRSALRQTALDTLIAEQHDAHSSKFHQWLTPQQYGDAFGVDDADIAAVKSWLTSQGFTVHGVYPSKMQIDFSGNAGLVKSAFHTQEKRYALNDADHIGNASDISIPAALESVVTGIAGLNDVEPQALHLAPKLTQFNHSKQQFEVASSKANAARGPITDAVNTIGTNGIRGLVPYDLAKIYGVDQLHTQGITGKGITIAVVEAASMEPADWTNFVQQFNLGSYGGTYTQIQPQATGLTNCIDPNVDNPPGSPNYDPDDGETLLDAEWSTAMAPGAHIVVASCGGSNSNNFFGGMFTAANNLINGTSRPDVISASYGYGEDKVDAASKTAIDLMWSQADVEGISVFVSTGDSGANPDFNGGVIQGASISANALATSLNVTAVGGTDFADPLDHTTAKYFSATPNADYGSALSYVPEIPWNWSCGNQVAAKSLGYPDTVSFCKQQLAFDPQALTATSEAGSGGPSSLERKPAWQRLVHNAAKDQSRDLPDVSLYAGSYGDTTRVIVCDAANPCTAGFLSPVDSTGGTSLASPMFAGIQALIDQGLAAKGLPKDQGNAAPTLYALAANEYGGATGAAPASLATCSADNGAKGTGSCVFHNVTRGGISAQCLAFPTPAAGFSPITTPDCYFYGDVSNYLGFFGSLFGPGKLGLTSTSAGKYAPAFSSQPGWSFATGLGSVNAKNLLAAWKSFVNAP